MLFLGKAIFFQLSRKKFEQKIFQILFSHISFKKYKLISGAKEKTLAFYFLITKSLNAQNEQISKYFKESLIFFRAQIIFD